MPSYPRIAYFGTPEFAARILTFLRAEGVPVVGVVTQPDRPQGRSHRPVPSPVKQAAAELPILQPERCSDPTFLQTISTWNAELFVVVAFGQILPTTLLEIPPKGCINIHASLLPHLRGAAPIQRALINGDLETGVCIQRMVRKLDAGDVIAQKRVPIGPDTTFGELHDTLCQVSQPLLLQVLQAYATGIPSAHPQDESRVTFAPKIDPSETQIDWTRSPQEIHNQVRGLSPRPGAWCWAEVSGDRRRLKVLRTRIVQEILELVEVQPEGRTPMPYSQWLRGCKATPIFR